MAVVPPYPYQRFVVIGSTGCGKSTMAEALSRKLSLEYIELDALYWRPDWTHISVEDFQAKVTEAIHPEKWAVAGNYHFARELTWNAAEVVVWLDYDFWTIFWRLWNRTWRRWWTKEMLWGANQERLWPHLKIWSVQDSLFAWLIKTYQRRKTEYSALLQQPEYAQLILVHLKTPKEADNWLESIPNHDGD
jgi:adenylate kinase family enzyme